MNENNAFIILFSLDFFLNILLCFFFFKNSAKVNIFLSFLIGGFSNETDLKILFNLHFNALLYFVFKFQLFDFLFEFALLILAVFVFAYIFSHVSFLFNFCLDTCTFFV